MLTPILGENKEKNTSKPCLISGLLIDTCLLTRQVVAYILGSLSEEFLKACGS
ncbi:hypothetical protein NT6N_15100 [Oceaniferula spumae]|uniref:Uncharacterized protein n=1 Tax=Oceaniferula spumae TaxID=2979115 RepID=A0AAT9FKG9_9BACT